MFSMVITTLFVLSAAHLSVFLQYFKPTCLTLMPCISTLHGCLLNVSKTLELTTLFYRANIYYLFVTILNPTSLLLISIASKSGFPGTPFSLMCLLMMIVKVTSLPTGFCLVTMKNLLPAATLSCP